MMPAVNTQLSVPPGFRFHPTDEELLHYYLRKKVSYEAIDLDVIREVDLNKLEPWDLKEKCRIGSGPQNEWYFFSHKDKKYPTGTRTNRATTAGFWKATGRDKAIHLNSSKRIGMRKTLVFYIGRAPHGQKTDWIMHEYRLDDENAEIQEDGWVVCRVFKKKITTRGFQPEIADHLQEDHHFTHIEASSSTLILEPKQNSRSLCHDDYTFDNSMHLPQLLSTDQSAAAIHPAAASFLPVHMNGTHDLVECSHNLLRLTSASSCGLGFPLPEKFSSDWSFLDKLLANSNQGGFDRTKCYPLMSQVATHDVVVPSAQKFPFQYLGSQPDHFSNFSK